MYQYICQRLTGSTTILCYNGSSQAKTMLWLHTHCHVNCWPNTYEGPRSDTSIIQITLGISLSAGLYSAKAVFLSSSSSKKNPQMSRSPGCILSRAEKAGIRRGGVCQNEAEPLYSNLEPGNQNAGQQKRKKLSSDLVHRKMLPTAKPNN